MHKNVSTLANHSFSSTTKIRNILEKKIYIFGIGVVSEKKLVPRMTSSPPSPSSSASSSFLMSPPPLSSSSSSSSATTRDEEKLAFETEIRMIVRRVKERKEHHRSHRFNDSLFDLIELIFSHRKNQNLKEKIKKSLQIFGNKIIV